MAEPVDVLVIGLGAVGSIYSYVLSQGGARVTAVARGSFERFQRDGINIASEKFGDIDAWKPYRICPSVEDADDRPYRYIIACFKCIPDLVPTASILAPVLESQHSAGEEKPTVVLIQNGIGIEHPVQQSYRDIPIISVVAWIGTNLKPDGRVTHGMLEKLVIGLYEGEGRGAELNPQSGETSDPFFDPAGYKLRGGEERRRYGLKRTQEFASILEQGGGSVEISGEIQARRFEKNVWNASLSSMCTISRSTVSACVSEANLPFTLPVVRRTMLEVLYVARAWGYDESVLPLKCVDDAIRITLKNYGHQSSAPVTPAVRQDALGGADYFPEEGSEETAAEATRRFKPSMLLDVEAGRPTELEPIIGSLLDRARARGVATPRLDTVYAALKIHQEAVIRQHAQKLEYREHITAWLQRRPAIAGLGLEGRKAWERAMKREGLSSPGQVAMGERSVPKVGGKATALDRETGEEAKLMARFD